MRPLGGRNAINFEFTKMKSSIYPAYASRRYFDAKRNDGHIHDFMQVWYCCSGSYTHQVGQQVYECGAGSLVMVPAGVYHEISFTEEGTEVLELNVSYRLFLEAAPDRIINTTANLCQNAFSQQLRTYVMLSPQSRLLADDYLSWISTLRYTPPEIASKEELYEKIESLFSLPELAIEEKHRKKVQHIAQTQIVPIFQILSYMNIHYPEKIEEEDILQYSGISRRGMYRYFKKIIGLTYSQYLQQLRVGHAIVYLRQSRYSLTHISDLCGFCDVSYMSRVFQKCIGESPKKTLEIMKICKK